MAATQTYRAKRHKWTEAEEMELKVLFQKAFTDGSCPRTKDLQNAVKKSSDNKGIIHLLPTENIKKKVSNMLLKIVRPLQS